MYACSLGPNIATKVNIFITYFVVLNVLIHGIKFFEQETGFNLNLNLFEMQAIQSKSKLTCGVLCEEKECASFLYEVSSKQCRIYSVFMTDENAEAIGKYYKRQDVEDFRMEANECSTKTLPSQDTNIALHKHVSMSSTYQVGVSSGSLMTDGSRSSAYPCASTGYDAYPEAVIDLGHIYAISTMYIVNRGDCCPERLHDLIIQIGDNLTNLTTVFNHTGAIGADCKIPINPQHQGRYVSLYIDGTEYLTVCELEVYSSG